MKYKIEAYIKVDSEETELFDSIEEAEKSYNESDDTIYKVVEVEE